MSFFVNFNFSNYWCDFWFNCLLTNQVWKQQTWFKKKKKHFNNISDSWPKYDWFALYSVYDYNIDLIPDKTDLFEPDLAELGKVTLPDCLEPSNPEINTITTL